MNLIVGPNGSGKTSLVEAVHLLGNGRSFRPGRRSDWIRSGARAFGIAATVGVPPQVRKFRLDGDEQALVATDSVLGRQPLTEGLRQAPTVTIDADARLLITGGSEPRRRLVDGLLFHVEPAALSHFRSAKKALAQRNAALRAGRSDTEIETWDHELVRASEALTPMRQQMTRALLPHVVVAAERLTAATVLAELRWQPGYPKRYASLAEALRAEREGDRARGYSRSGPHRGDLVWTLRGSQHRSLSRGQEKLLACGWWLAAAQLLAERAHSPLLQVDDYTAELDAEHQQALLEAVGVWPGQSIVTSPIALRGGPQPQLMANTAVFHVEQGQLRA